MRVLLNVQRHRVLLAAAAAGLLSAVAGPRPVLAQSQGTRVGVVNVTAVSRKIQELKEFGDHVRNQQALLEASAKGHQAQLTDLQQRAHNLKPDSDAFEDAAKQFQQKAAEFNMDDQLKKADLIREINRENKLLFLEVQSVAADLAKQKGLDLVIVEPEVQLPTNVQEMNPDQLDTLIRQKTLLYVSPKIDITDEVATALDAAFKNKGSGGAVAPAGR